MLQKKMSVILGPAAELHPGIHGELIDNPPHGVTYFLPEHRHRFLFPKLSDEPFDPFQHFAFSQTVEFALTPGARAIVHSSRIPVFNRVPWLLETDCLLETLNAGTFYVLGTGGRALANRNLVRHRQRLMLGHYLSDRCAGLLFRTEYARRNFARFVQEQGLLAESDYLRLAGKTDVLRPTTGWRDTGAQKKSKPTIVYMGRFREGKGGAIALEVFRRIKARYKDGVDLVYVGQLPTSDASVPSGITCHALLDRPTYLNILGCSHIFLSPTESESYGFGLVEAASYGLAIVTRCGPGMEHIGELFEHGKNALLVSGESSAAVDAYEQNVRWLLDDPMFLKNFYGNNFELFRSGTLSLEIRDRKLLGYYSRMLLQSTQAPGGGQSLQSVDASREFQLKTCILSDGECQRRRALPNVSRRVLLSW
jgi:glycosyltransferase involved in cell wall biosynthesis